MPLTARKQPSGPKPSTPEWNTMHVQLAVMVEGRREECARFLRRVADSIDKGCVSGITIDASPVRGNWFMDR